MLQEFLQYGGPPSIRKGRTASTELMDSTGGRESGHRSPVERLRRAGHAVFSAGQSASPACRAGRRRTQSSESPSRIHQPMYRHRRIRTVTVTGPFSPCAGVCQVFSTTTTTSSMALRSISALLMWDTIKDCR